MKDSHIGSYGVFGLIIYYLLAYNLLVALPLTVTPFLLLSGDTWSKFISSNIINYLPYARKEEDSKSGTVYTRMNLGEIVMSAMGGILPLLLLPPSYWPVCIFPILVFSFICRMMKRRLLDTSDMRMGVAVNRRAEEMMIVLTVCLRALLI